MSARPDLDLDSHASCALAAVEVEVADAREHMPAIQGDLEPLPPHSVILVPATLPMATLLSGLRLAKTDGPRYRAVVACARTLRRNATEQ